VIFCLCHLDLAVVAFSAPEIGALLAAVAILVKAGFYVVGALLPDD
jgi:hypothetical protein